jgi:PPOX class probable F420-dependent enzyme
MSKEEREAFLADVHVAVISIADGDRGPLTAPVWYMYEPGGDIRFTIGADSRKMQRLRETNRMSLCVQTETAPYAYVTVEGPVTLGPSDFEGVSAPIARRYLGEAGAKAYYRGREGDSPDTVLVTLKPERWLTTDYSKR